MLVLLYGADVIGHVAAIVYVMLLVMLPMFATDIHADPVIDCVTNNPDDERRLSAWAAI